MRKTYISILSLGIVLITGSCEKDENQEIVNNDNAYTVSLKTVSNGDYDNGSADYLMTIPSLTEGTISAKSNGIEQFGFRSYGAFNQSILSVGYSQANTAIKYNYVNGQLTEKETLVFESTLDLIAPSENSNESIGISVPRSDASKRVFHKINHETMEIKDQKESIIYFLESDGTERPTIAYPTALVIREDNLFVPFYMLNILFQTPHTDTAYLAVYSYPELELQSIEKDTRMGPIGIYGSVNGMIKFDNGDIYGYSSASAACGFTTQEKSSGILRVKSNSNTFDPDYFYDFEGASGKKINWMGYLGGNKVIARVFKDQTSPLWAAYPNASGAGPASIMNLVIIDLESESYVEVEGVPDHIGSFNTPLYVENGKAFMSISTTLTASDETDQSAIYSIDITSAKATKGAIINGFELGFISKVPQ